MVFRTGCLADTKSFEEKFNSARTRRAQKIVIEEYTQIYRRRQQEASKCPGLGLAIDRRKKQLKPVL